MPYKKKTCPDCNKSIDGRASFCKSCSQSGKRNHQFGNHAERPYQYKKDASYKAIHLWVKVKKGKPQACQHCGKTRKEGRLEWANIDHRYSRVPDDYIPLCCACHIRYDCKKGFRTYRCPLT